MSLLLHLSTIVQTASENLDKIEPHQFAFNPVTLADRYDDGGWVGAFTPINAADDWFVEDLKDKNLKNYFMLDLREESNRQIFADFDGFGDKWRQSVADKYDDSTPPWEIFGDLLNMRANHAKKHPVHYTFAVEGNHRRITP